MITEKLLVPVGGQFYVMVWNSRRIIGQGYAHTRAAAEAVARGWAASWRRPMSGSKRQVLTYEANGRMWTVYGCARRGCDAINLDYESFGARDGRSYCLDHVPLRSRLRLWWQERS